MRRAALILFLLSLFGEFASPQQWLPMTFKADAPGIDQNPLRGFVPYAATPVTPGEFPHSMEWFYLPLSAVVTGPDTYRWSPVEHQLNRIAARGHQAVFRFYLDYPTHPGGIPQYLLDAGLRTFSYSDFENATAPTPSVSPDYSNPQLMECLLHFVQALGTRYDGDPRIAFLTAGLYGFWGEWHVNDHPRPGDPAGWAMSQTDKDRLLQTYVSSFHRTPIEVRYASVTRDPVLLANFGLHDDSFLQDTLGTAPWHFWPTVSRAGAAESWQSHPTGGEVRPEVQSHLFDAWPNAEGEDLQSAIATIHPTWLLDETLFSDTLSTKETQNALRAERLLGYTLYCSAVRVTQSSNGGTTVSLRIENRGVAPIAYAWPVQLEALDAAKEPIAQAQATWPLTNLMPGTQAEWTIQIVLPSSVSALVLQIVNPLKNGNPIAFANAEMGTVIARWLTLPLPPEPR